jgi:hypothetical protein
MSMISRSGAVHERAALDRARMVFFFLAGTWEGFSVEETAVRLIRPIPNMAARFELPINAGSRRAEFRKETDNTWPRWNSN